MSEYYVNEIEVDGKPLLCFSDGRIYKLPFITTHGRRRKGSWAKPWVHGAGYLGVGIGRKTHLAHRIIAKAFLSNYSEDLEVDHMDGDKQNNKVSNLRMVTHKQNHLGYKLNRKGSKSQYRGVCWNKGKKKWQAQISIDSKYKYLGIFDCQHEAAKVWNAAATKLGFLPEALNVITNQ